MATDTSEIRTVKVLPKYIYVKVLPKYIFVKVFPKYIDVKVFPKHIYVKTDDSQITVFTTSRICCVVTRLAASYCCRFSKAALGRDIDSFEKYRVFLRIPFVYFFVFFNMWCR